MTDDVEPVSGADSERAARPHHPVVEKVKTDQEIIIPEGHRFGENMQRGQKLLYRFMWYLVQAIARGYFRTTVIGTGNVPRQGAFIVSPIHRSNLDTPVIATVTRRRLRYMGKESLWKSKFGAWFLTTMGGFPVERASADREALRACQEVLDRGEPLVMFPEGTRQFGPTVCEMFDGPAFLAARAQVPIVPIGIGGSERALGKGMKFPRPRKMVVVVGRPIEPPAPGPKGRVSRRAVKELTSQLGHEIQILFDDAQARAGHPNVYDRGDTRTGNGEERPQL